MPITRNTSRLLLGAVFTYSGFVKAIDPLGSTYKFIEYFHAAGLDGIDPLALLASLALSLAEFITGVALLLNLRLRLASAVALLFMTLFTPFTLFLAIARPVSDCGCFGDALPLTPWLSFWKNIALLLLAIIVRAKRKRYTSPLTAARQNGVLLLSATYMLLLSWHAYRTLPPLDFRPYAEGKNIAEQTRTPEEENPGLYRLTLYYKNTNTGEIKAFTADNYPWQDSTWTHQRTERQWIQKNDTPPLRDFSIEHPLQGDITREVLESNDYILLLVARQIEKVPRETQARVNRLAYHLHGKGYRVIGLTSSPDDAVSEFNARYRVPYDICTTDDTQLKTMIRANPGFLLLHRGTILVKGAGQDIPEVAELEGKDLLARLVSRKNARRDNLLVTTLLLLLSTTYLLLRPARRGRTNNPRRGI
ncbi:MAG: DoxX family membrane protein [Odoribacteraceae bacterium]|jgi:uncharacterized membrane protein YphA (DoxX/SURF4 family)|nr:DoxX family membrane protein [Odoribacteraceae bacterium]